MKRAEHRPRLRSARIDRNSPRTQAAVLVRRDGTPLGPHASILMGELLAAENNRNNPRGPAASAEWIRRASVQWLQLVVNSNPGDDCEDAEALDLVDGVCGVIFGLLSWETGSWPHLDPESLADHTARLRVICSMELSSREGLLQYRRATSIFGDAEGVEVRMTGAGMIHGSVLADRCTMHSTPEEFEQANVAAWEAVREWRAAGSNEAAAKERWQRSANNGGVRR